MSKLKPNHSPHFKHFDFFESITYAEINEYLYDNLTVSVISILILATILFFGLYGFIEKTPLMIWYGSVLIVLVFRIGMLIWFRKTRQELKLQNYHYRFFILGSSLSGMLWGILGSFLMPANIVSQTFIIIMVSGIMAGATISLGVRYLAAVLYIFFSLFPIIIWEGGQILKGNQAYIGIFIAMVLYLFYSGITAYKNSGLIRNNIALKYQNLHLMRNLTEQLRKIQLFSQMGELLDKCHNKQEIGKTCKKYLARIFPEFSGAIFLLSAANKKRLKAFAVWGDFSSNNENIVFSQDECLAIKTKTLYISDDKKRCLHCAGSSGFYVCIPLQTLLTFYGVLHLKLNSGIISQKEDFISSQKDLMMRIATNLSFALSTIQYQKILQMEATQDTLTGLYNRRYLDNYFNMELTRYKRKSIPIAIMMLDIDYFKKFNDQYGHEFGDIILRELGVFLKNSVRGSDFACRYGGEEFVLILPESGLGIALERAENIREGVKHISILKDGKSVSGITLSIGVAIFPEQGNTQASIIEAADKALYRAKEEGRDRVCIANF